MKRIPRRTFLKTVLAFAALPLPPALFELRRTSRRDGQRQTSVTPFGQDFPQLDAQATGQWWKARESKVAPIIDLNVPRDQVVAFALYTHHSHPTAQKPRVQGPGGGVLKLTAQLYPLRPEESRQARLEIRRNGAWVEVARAPVEYPGWSAHFRVDRWDTGATAAYRVRHGVRAAFEGVVRRDPVEKDEIVVANLGCNSSRTKGVRPEIVRRLLDQNPDLLFFSGDQTYHHTEHTAGWIEFGLQYRELMRDRPTICIPDDHDVGHGNLWGEEGSRATHSGGADGGYLYPPEYVNMVQRAQAWHLPDPVDAAPVGQGIHVYFTRLRVGGIDFAILEDRKFKTGPMGAIPQMGPRPDHITDDQYDPRTIDLPGLQLLGERQMRFLRDWTQDWTGADVKCVLSQTAFCGAAHVHGKPDNRLLADLDCNGWPQSRRNETLRELRKARAIHLCGDQHLAATVKHGIDDHRDGPYAFTSPALVNTVYARWWHPKDERAGANAIAGSPLPWTGDYLDGLGNRISMIAYANPEDLADETKRADGYGLVRFNKRAREVTFECWPRFSQGEQFAGWPITVKIDDNDGRRAVAWLPELIVEGSQRPVVQVISEADGEILYTIRAANNRFQPPVYSHGSFTVKIGRNRPDAIALTRSKAVASADAAGVRKLRI